MSELPTATAAPLHQVFLSDCVDWTENHGFSRTVGIGSVVHKCVPRHISPQQVDDACFSRCSCLQLHDRSAFVRPVLSQKRCGFHIFEWDAEELCD